MPLLLVLEDTPAAPRLAVDMAQRAGFTEFEVSRFPTDAKLYLENAMSGKVPRPGRDARRSHVRRRKWLRAAPVLA